MRDFGAAFRQLFTAIFTMLYLGFHGLKACSSCGSVSSDEETACGVCGTSFSEVQDTIDERVPGSTLQHNARQVVIHGTLLKLGAWLAILAMGLGLVFFTWTNALFSEIHYYYGFGRGFPWVIGVFTLGLVLVAFALAWASVWLYPERGKRRLTKDGWHTQTKEGDQI